METKARERAWCVWLGSPNAAIYSCHFLASWSGRMWAFSMGLFLISISPDSLHLSAKYGLTMGASVLLLGTIIGNWVDTTARLKAALVSMILQNSFVILCACMVFTLLFLLSENEDMDSGLKIFFYVLIVGLSVSSRLMKVARVIVVERDWIVEISHQNKTDLSVMTSTFRRIDLLTKICAPIFTGQIMTYAGLKISCGVISLWSLVSLCVEYFLIQRVYNTVPALRALKDTAGVAGYKEHSFEVSNGKKGNPHEESQPLSEIGTKPTNQDEVVAIKSAKPFSPLRFFDSFIILFRGFRTYVSYDVKWPGIALAFLYLTVLGFDGITVGYAATQGMSGSLLGILMGTGAVFGITATFTYPYIVRRLGLAKTGVLALSLQLTCLSLCVISVWLPGSPFDPTNEGRHNALSSAGNASLGNCSLATASVPDGIVNVTMNATLPAQLNATAPCQPGPGAATDEENQSMISVWVMLAGIVTARFGLWTADLAIIQLFLENVAPSQRGIVNGFQSSLNQMMDFFKYALVVAIPLPPQFGFLIFISYFFISIGWTFMLVFAIRSRSK